MLLPVPTNPLVETSKKGFKSEYPFQRKLPVCTPTPLTSPKVPPEVEVNVTKVDDVIPVKASTSTAVPVLFPVFVQV